MERLEESREAHLRTAQLHHLLSSGFAALRQRAVTMLVEAVHDFVEGALPGGQAARLEQLPTAQSRAHRTVPDVELLIGFLQLAGFEILRPVLFLFNNLSTLVARITCRRRECSTCAAGTGCLRSSCS